MKSRLTPDRLEMIIAYGCNNSPDAVLMAQELLDRREADKEPEPHDLKPTPEPMSEERLGEIEANFPGYTVYRSLYDAESLVTEVRRSWEECLELRNKIDYTLGTKFSDQYHALKSRAEKAEELAKEQTTSSKYWRRVHGEVEEDLRGRKLYIGKLQRTVSSLRKALTSIQMICVEPGLAEDKQREDDE